MLIHKSTDKEPNTSQPPDRQRKLLRLYFLRVTISDFYHYSSHWKVSCLHGVRQHRRHIVLILQWEPKVFQNWALLEFLWFQLFKLIELHKLWLPLQSICWPIPSTGIRKYSWRKVKISGIIRNIIIRTIEYLWDFVMQIFSDACFVLCSTFPLPLNLYAKQY